MGFLGGLQFLLKILCRFFSFLGLPGNKLQCLGVDPFLDVGFLGLFASTGALGERKTAPNGLLPA